MNTQQIPMAAQLLLREQKALEALMAQEEAIINKAEKSPMGMTLDSAKTPEWRVAKRLHGMYWEAYRQINQRLNKMRTVVGYEAVNGKRVAIYKYN